MVKVSWRVRKYLPLARKCNVRYAEVSPNSRARTVVMVKAEDRDHLVLWILFGAWDWSLKKNKIVAKTIA